MRRTAALLALVLGLTLPLPGEPGSILGYSFYHWGSDGVTRRWFHFIPYILLIASCAGRGLAPHALQAAGSAWLLFFAASDVVDSSFPGRSFLYLSPIAGIALVSILEAAVYPRLAPEPKPDRRFAVSLLLILAGANLIGAILNWMAPVSIPGTVTGSAAYLLRYAAYPAGLASAFLVCAWGARADQRWGAWIGAALTGWLACAALWELARMFFAQRNSGAAIFALHHRFPWVALESTAAFLLGRRAWMDVRANLPRPSPAPGGS